MALFADGRIPVATVDSEAALAVFLALRPGAAILAESPPGPLPEGAVAQARFDPRVPAHAIACHCCSGRTPMAQALDRLFLARVKGRTPWFRQVVALLPAAEARDALAATLRDDAVTAGRYRAEA
jgi:hypothetical protein